MRTDRYLIRAVKYFVLLIVLIVALYALSYYFESTPMSVEDYIAMLRADERSKWLLPVLILLALAYPAFGYMTRSLPISLEQNRAGVDAAMTACEFELTGEREEEALALIKNLRGCAVVSCLIAVASCASAVGGRIGGVVGGRSNGDPRSSRGGGAGHLSLGNLYEKREWRRTLNISCVALRRRWRSWPWRLC